MTLTPGHGYLVELLSVGLRICLTAYSEEQFFSGKGCHKYDTKQNLMRGTSQKRGVPNMTPNGI